MNKENTSKLWKLIQDQYESMDKRTSVAQALKKQIDLLDGKIDAEIKQLEIESKEKKKLKKKLLI